MRTKKQRTPKWELSDVGPYYIADNGERSTYVHGAHCRACALTKLVLEYGGNVDLRGLSSYGPCFQMLVVTVRAARDPEALDEPEAGRGDSVVTEAQAGV